MEVRLQLLHLSVGECAAAEQGLRVQLARGALGVDQSVHDGLGHRWVIALVVTTAAVAHQVDHNVLAELLAVFECQLTDAHDVFRIIAVDVEDRCLNCAGHVGGVLGGA